MKFHLRSFLALVLALPAFATPVESSSRSADGTPEGLEKSDWQSIRAAHDAWLHEFREVDGKWQANNPGQRWTTTFDGRGFLAQPQESEWTWGLELHSYGFASNPQTVSGTPEIKAHGQRLSYHWQGGLEEWFINDGRGLEHGFIVAQRPEGAEEGEPLVFTLLTLGGLRPSVANDAQTVYFRDAGGAPILNYSGLKVWDADGVILTSRFERGEDGKFSITVEEADAKYPITIDPIAQQAYLKASSNGGRTNDGFGASVAVSGDTVVIGAPNEDSSSTGVNSAPNENALDSGAAYVFVRSGTTWTQQAYLKASNTGENDLFGYSVAVTAETVIVGAYGEASSSTGINSTPNEGASFAGAAYVFFRSGTTWSQQAYIKPSNTGAGDSFGFSVAISGDTAVVGSPSEDSSTTGVNSNPNNLSTSSGAAYVFVRNGTTWTQQAYLKASNTGGDDSFGWSVAVSGNTVVIGSPYESSSTIGVNSTPNESATRSGAAYVFVRSGTTWIQQAYLKASNTGEYDSFGRSVAVSVNTVVVGAYAEASSTTGVNSNSNNIASASGAAYVFLRSGTTWSQQAYLKASNTGAYDFFGYSVAVSGDTVVVGASQEMSNATGVNGNQADDTGSGSGAVYVFLRNGTTWTQQSYLKASNTGPYDYFGHSVAVSGDTVVVGAYWEDSSTTGVNSTPNEDAQDSGASYVFVRSGTTWTQQAYLKASNTPSDPGLSDVFGASVAVSGDTVVVGAYGESSNTTGVNSTPNESASGSGAAYVFTRSGTSWTQQAYLKASQVTAGDQFGYSVAVSGDTVVVGAPSEGSSTTGINSTANEGASFSGAAYVFARNGTTWSQQAYLKASQVTASDQFGSSVAVSDDTVVVGAPNEDSSTTDVDSTPNESASNSGAAYVFIRTGTIWGQQAYLKANNTGANDQFGFSVGVSGDVAVIGAAFEDSNTIGVNSISNNSASDSGAAYVFSRSGMSWNQQAYLKASNTGANDIFGYSVAISGDTVVVGAIAEDSGELSSGAAYVFVCSGITWSQQAFLKASNTGSSDLFGGSVAVSADTVVVGASYEDSSTTGVNSTPNHNASDSGAAYVFVRNGVIWTEQAYLKASNTDYQDLFGCSVAVSGDTVVVGAEREDSSTTGVNSAPNEIASDSGAAYIFNGLGPAHIAVEAPTGTELQNGVNFLSFAQTITGQSSDLTVIIRNNGGADLTGILATITGTDASQFQLFTEPLTSLFGGETTTFTVRFVPNSLGSKTATLSIASSDSDENPFTIALSGTGNTPPTYAGYAASTAYQTSASITLGKLISKAADADGHAVSITAAGLASAQGGTAVLQAGAVLYTPPALFSGIDSFQITITDALGATVQGAVTVTVGSAPADGGQGVNPPQLTMISGGDVGISFQGIPGRSYQIQRSPDMTPGSWQTIATVVAAPNGAVTFTDEDPPPGSAYYRMGIP